MNCHEIVQRLAAISPDLSQVELARLTLMILVQTEDSSRLQDDQALIHAWKSATFRLESASDQHAAVANELDRMCNDGPVQFTPDQLWVLLRAMKVQSQDLELYTEADQLRQLARKLRATARRLRCDVAAASRP